MRYVFLYHDVRAYERSHFRVQFPCTLAVSLKCCAGGGGGGGGGLLSNITICLTHDRSQLYEAMVQL